MSSAIPTMHLAFYASSIVRFYSTASALLLASAAESEEFNQISNREELTNSSINQFAT